MAACRVQMTIVMTISFFLVHTVLRIDSACYGQTCSSYASGCSTNANCVCFEMVNGTGMCAGQTSTSSFHACTPSLTCADNTTICVVNSCFGQPLCYPLSYASYSTCPPATITATPVNIQPVTPYRPPVGQGNGGGQDDGGLDPEIDAELEPGEIGGIAAAVVVVVVIIIIIIVCLVMFRPGC